MKILFISYHYWPPHFGGELLLSIERFESLVHRGHSVIVLTSGVSGSVRHETINGIQIQRSPEIHPSKPGRGLRRLFFPWWLLHKIRHLDYDLVHMASAGGIGPVTAAIASWLVSRLVKKRNKKLIFVHSLADTETEMYSESGIARKIRKANWSKADAIVSVAPALHATVSPYFPNSARLIPNGIRDDLFQPIAESERAEKRKQEGITENQVIFTFLGTVNARKGFDLLAKAFLELEPDNPDWRLWVIGPKSSLDSQNFKETQMADIFPDLDRIPDKVRFWGRVNDREKISNILGISDVFVLPTRKEGMPLAPLEAMAAGLPVILSRIPGVTDLANIEGETGYYSEVNDLPSLMTAMVKLGSNDELRRKMGAAARKRVQTGFGWNGFIDNWERLFITLTAK